MIALAVRGYARRIGRLYAFDLAGAGLGAVVVVPLMWLVDAPTLIVGLALVAAVAALLFAGGRSARAALGARAARRWPSPLVVLAATTGLYAWPPASTSRRIVRTPSAGRRSAGSLGYAAGPQRPRTRSCPTTGLSRRCRPTGAASRCRTGGAQERPAERSATSWRGQATPS